MNRTIEFRGKRVDNGEWVYGCLLYDFSESYKLQSYNNVPPKTWKILDFNGNRFTVLPETIGQFTGLTDKNGVKVFEGDILRCNYFKIGVCENLSVREDEAEITGIVSFNDLSLCISEIKGKEWEEYTGYAEGEGETPIMFLHDVYEGSSDCEHEIEVIGNIHETPPTNE